MPKESKAVLPQTTKTNEEDRMGRLAVSVNIPTTQGEIKPEWDEPSVADNVVPAAMYDWLSSVYRGMHGYVLHVVLLPNWWLCRIHEAVGIPHRLCMLRAWPRMV